MGLFDIFKTKEATKQEKIPPPPEKIPEKPKQSENTYSFDDADRERALEARRQAAERRAIIDAQNQRLKDLQAQRQALDLERQIKRLEKSVYNDDDEDDDEDDDSGDYDGEDYSEDGYIQLGELAPLIRGFMSGFNKNSSITPPTQNIITATPETPRPQLIDFSEDAIKTFIDTLPKTQLAIAQRMPDDDLIKIIKSQIPNISDNSAKLALDIVKKKELKVVKNAKK